MTVFCIGALGQNKNSITTLFYDESKSIKNLIDYIFVKSIQWKRTQLHWFIFHKQELNVYLFPSDVKAQPIFAFAIRKFGKSDNSTTVDSDYESIDRTARVIVMDEM